jgi:hypothetical protein
MARESGVDLPGWWHANVIHGTGDDHTYHGGDLVKLFPATPESIEALREPRTPKGSVAKIPKATGGPPGVVRPRRDSDPGFETILRSGRHAEDDYDDN